MRVRGYSPGASIQHAIVHRIFRLAVRGDELELTLIRQDLAPSDQSVTRADRLPYLTHSPVGNLRLIGPNGRYDFKPPTRWTYVPRK